MSFNLSNREKVFLRILAGIIFLCIAFLSPWRFWLPVGFIFLIIVKKFPEILIAAFATDLIYGTATGGFFGFRYVFTVATIILIVASYFIKRLLRTNFR